MHAKEGPDRAAEGDEDARRRDPGGRDARDPREIARVQHQLERQQHDERVAPDEDTERADPEQDGGDRDVPGDIGAEHQVARLVCEPRITPPTAAMSRTTEVISKARRWST